MQIRSLFLLLACPAVISGLATPSVSRGNDTDFSSERIVRGISTVRGTTNAIDEIVSSFSGRSLGAKAFRIQRESTLLKHQLQELTLVAHSCETFTPEGSEEIAKAALDFSPDVQHLLQNIVDHHCDFGNAILFVGSVQGRVRKNLIQLKTASDGLFEAVSTKLAAPFCDGAGAVRDPIDQAFDQAIEAYAKENRGCRRGRGRGRPGDDDADQAPVDEKA